jgi:hypothetical protein
MLRESSPIESGSSLVFSTTELSTPSQTRRSTPAPRQVGSLSTVRSGQILRQQRTPPRRSAKNPCVRWRRLRRFRLHGTVHRVASMPAHPASRVHRPFCSITANNYKFHFCPLDCQPRFAKLGFRSGAGKDQLILNLLLSGRVRRAGVVPLFAAIHLRTSGFAAGNQFLAPCVARSKQAKRGAAWRRRIWPRSPAPLPQG